MWLERSRSKEKRRLKALPSVPSATPYRRRCTGRRVVRRLGEWQCVLVHLAVWRERHAEERHEERGHGVCRQLRSKEAAHLVDEASVPPHGVHRTLVVDRVQLQTRLSVGGVRLVRRGEEVAEARSCADGGGASGRRCQRMRLSLVRH